MYSSRDTDGCRKKSDEAAPNRTQHQHWAHQRRSAAPREEQRFRTVASLRFLNRRTTTRSDTIDRTDLKRKPGEDRQLAGIPFLRNSSEFANDSDDDTKHRNGTRRNRLFARRERLKPDPLWVGEVASQNGVSAVDQRKNSIVLWSDIIGLWFQKRFPSNIK